MTDSPLSSIADAIDTIANGGIVIVIDDEDRENEGDLIMAAEHATPEAIGFFVRHTSGFICVPMTAERAAELRLPQMVAQNQDALRTAYTITVDYRHGTTTGISATERAMTIRALADPTVTADDFTRPGHVVPLEAREGGVLRRTGHTEAAVDLARLAGLAPVGVLCEVVKPDGDMARLADLVPFAAEHGLPIITIADLVRYRRRTDKTVHRVSTAAIPTQWGDFKAHAFRSDFDTYEHVAFVMGDVADGEDVLVRVHSECLTGDIFGSLRCDCGPQLASAMARIAADGRGVLVYLRGHEGRGIGLGHKLRAYELQEAGRDTVDANTDLGLPVDDRDYGVGAQILADLGIRSMLLMTNNPAKYTGLSGYDFTINGRVSLPTEATAQNIDYLRTKVERMGHLLELDPTLGSDGSGKAG
ncbi:MAG: bifunctional 3,4-dihydroxy-2-butanone-4-phosphate synthase/GTP cyclohydrolase II [Acidimicrobiia bacterium]|nr:bifunctional 3,4-dihydroxy-2-butanone-4-phosphate synthase/GTP cyclohydrolase II [Acidimicrobiia bacterium]